VSNEQKYPAPTSNPDNSAEKQAEYCAKLEAMENKALFDETRNRLWLSAYANNNPRSCYHWQVRACYDETQRREKPNLYESAYEALRREIG